jgi:hypothetical protein
MAQLHTVFESNECELRVDLSAQLSFNFLGKPIDEVIKFPLRLIKLLQYSFLVFDLAFDLFTIDTTHPSNGILLQLVHKAYSLEDVGNIVDAPFLHV